MCSTCKSVGIKSGCAIAMGPRNAAMPGTDTDQGPDTQSQSLPKMTRQDLMELVAYQSLRYQKFSDDRLFDFSHPVDEFQPNGTVIASTLTVQPDYDMPEKIESITCIVPVGATSATIQLGARYLTVYSGAALAVPLIVLLDGIGIILNADDLRQVIFAGALTSSPYLGLTGYALTRGQFS
jgi:hypothetical protein